MPAAMPTLETYSTNSWLTPRRGVSSPRIQILCFPHAGGSASIYRDWPSLFPGEIQICAPELPGRGRRLREPLSRNLVALANSAAEFVSRSVQSPYALFGHSMGALMCFEMARLLSKRGKAPVRLFVAGARAPHFRPVDKRTFELPDEEFLVELREINGTPPELLEDAELMELLLPIIRADFEMVQTYRYAAAAPLFCPTTAFGGLQDADVALEQIQAWGEHTTGEFNYRLLPGSHFFINTAPREIAGAMLKQLTPMLDAH